MIVSLLIFFCVGVIQDFLVTLNWRFVAHGKIALASLFSFLVTMMSMSVLYTILSDLDETRNISIIISYSLGIAMGTVLAMQAEKKVGKK